jgi:hypothetical protein
VDQSPYRSAQASYQFDMATPIYAQLAAITFAVARARMSSGAPFAWPSALTTASLPATCAPRLGALSVGEDERDAVIELAWLRLFAYERGDLVAGCERLRDELAADAAGRAEDGELHVDASRSNAGTPSTIRSIAAP